jgi:hypothetical protein
MGRISSWLAAIFLVAALTLGYLYLKQRGEMALVRAEMAEKLANEQQSRRQLADFQQKLAAANTAAKKAEDELTAQDRAASSQPTGGAANRRLISTSDIAREFPEYAELQKKQMRRSILHQYGDALATLNLPPDQLAQLKDLLAGRVFQNDDPRLAGLEPGTPAYVQARREASQSISQQIDALIGPDGQRKLQNAAMLSTAQTQIANTYAPDFQDGGVPLSPEQTSSLAQLMNPMNGAGRGPGMNQADPTTGLTPADDALIEQAAQVLSPAQVAILKSDRVDQNKMNAIMQQYMGAGMQGGGGSITIIRR